MKSHLQTLSSSLLKFHRSLLMFQTELAEKADGRKYSPYELLNLSLNDSRFAWLRKFSELIIQIDTIIDDKKNAPYDPVDIASNVKKLISLDPSSPSEDLLFALKSDSSIMLPLSEVRRAVAELEKASQTESN